MTLTVKVTVNAFGSPDEAHFYRHQIDDQLGEITAEFQGKNGRNP
jgi:hypothetical protein